jgi:hypothetical protein
MTIFELGALGEFLGSIAVVFTLIYLTLQVRQTNINNNRAAIDQVWAQFQSLMSCLRNDPELCNIIRRGFWEWETLPKNDRAVLHSYWGDLVNHALMVFNLNQQGVISHRDYIGFEDNAISAITTDGIGAWWRENCNLYPKHFVDRIEQRLEDESSLPPKFPERFSFWEKDET